METGDLGKGGKIHGEIWGDTGRLHTLMVGWSLCVE